MRDSRPASMTRCPTRVSLLSMLERIERNSGTLLMLAVTASGGPGWKAKQAPGCRM